LKEFISRLTWVDYIVLIAVLRGCYTGYKSGLFPELLRIAAYLVTVVVTLQFYEPLAQFLTVRTFLNFGTASTISFFTLLAGVFFATKLLMMLVLKLLKVGEGGLLNRLVGTLLGAARWILLLSLAFMLVEYSPLTVLRTDIQNRSAVGPKISLVAPTIFEFLSALHPQLALPKKGGAG
jgi:membrane protein required for colicin V production